MDIDYSEEGRKKFYDLIDMKRKEVYELYLTGNITEEVIDGLFEKFNETISRYEGNRISYLNEQISLARAEKRKEERAKKIVRIEDMLGDISLGMKLLMFNLECALKEKRKN